MNRRRSVLVAAGLVLTACTSTVQGSGRTSEVSTASSPPSSTPSTTTSVPSSPRMSTTPFPPPDLARVPADSAIGDPVTANLCAAAGLAPFQHLPGGPSAAFDPAQYPPGCSITLSNADQPVFTVSVFAAKHPPHPADGRTETRVQGLPVYRYPFKESTGSCERDVVAPGVLLVADTLARGAVKPDSGLACAAADAMAERMAAAAAGGSVARLALAAPSVTELDACAVAKQAEIASSGTFAGANLRRRGFDVNCELRTEGAFLFLNIALVDTARAVPGETIRVDGHELQQTSVQPSFCSYASPQGSTGADLQEQVTATATAPGPGTPSADLCADTAAALARYLTAAGLT